jgi:hypothetical protein
VRYVDMRAGLRPPRTSWYGSLEEAVVNDFQMVRRCLSNPLMSIRMSDDKYHMTFWDNDGRLLLDIMYLEDKSLKYFV